MAYIPKIRQTPGADLEGGSLFTEEGRPYFGLYTQDVAGNFYTGEYITITSKPLYRVFPEGDLELRPQENFLVFYPKTTEEIKNRGYMERYFLQHPVTRRVKEVSEEGFKRERRLEKRPPFLFYQCTWYLKRNLSRRNEKAIEEGEKIMKGLKKQVLKSSLQFVE